MMVEMPQLVLISFAVSAAFCWLVILTQKFHSDFTGGSRVGQHSVHDGTVHAGAVPRVGGIGILLSLIIAAYLSDGALAILFQGVLLACFFVFTAGAVEDVTGRVSPKIRLIMSLVTGSAFLYFSGVMISNVNIGWVDAGLAWWPLAAILTVLAIASLVNAVNMIDGLNGLSIGTCCFMALSVAFFARQEGDAALVTMALIYTAALAGIGIFNFPFGKIFVGDGGAYLMGAFIAMLVILLPERNPNISAFTSLLIVIYPFYELSRTTVRRLLLGGNAMLPDNKHLHSLIYRRHIQLLNKDKRIVNYVSAIMALILPAYCAIWAVFCAHSVFLICTGIIIFIIIYEMLFRIYGHYKVKV